MTHFFGNHESITQTFPLTPFMVNVPPIKVTRGKAVITGETFTLEHHTIIITFLESDVDTFNGFNRGAVGAEATVQIHSNKPGNLTKALKKLYPKATTILVKKPAPTLVEYTICWSENI